MKIAVVGGGAAGMATAYWLDQQGHHVTVFERQPILGGHIRTLNKNVRPNCSNNNAILECGPLEFPSNFYNFIALMKELGVNLVPIDVGSALFYKNGDRILSPDLAKRNFAGAQRLVENIKFDSLHVRSAWLWLKTQLTHADQLSGQSLSDYLGNLENGSASSLWLKLLAMYSYSIPLHLIDDVPAELAIPMLDDYIAASWYRVEGGVYTYIEKILERFKGNIFLGVKITNIYRKSDGVEIEISTKETQVFDKVAIATPPDCVLKLLADPTESETRRFSSWKPNYITSIVHSDTAMYDRQGIRAPAEFDFFQTDTQTATQWGYSGYLNRVCGLSSPQHYFLSFQLDSLIDPDHIIHTQRHHTPMYTTESFRYRSEIVETNGENNTYYAGSYLGDGLHEGAIASAREVARLVSETRKLEQNAFRETLQV